MAAGMESASHFRNARYGGRQGEALRPGHVPLSVGRRITRRPPRGVYGDRYRLPLQPDARQKRLTSHGLGRLWLARRTTREEDGYQPRDYHLQEHRHLSSTVT